MSFPGEAQATPPMNNMNFDTQAFLDTWMAHGNYDSGAMWTYPTPEEPADSGADLFGHGGEYSNSYSLEYHGQTALLGNDNSFTKRNNIDPSSSLARESSNQTGSVSSIESWQNTMKYLPVGFESWGYDSGYLPSGSPTAIQEPHQNPPKFVGVSSGSPRLPSNPFPSPSTPHPYDIFSTGFRAPTPMNQSSIETSRLDQSFSAAASPSTTHENYDYSSSSTLSPTPMNTKVPRAYKLPPFNAPRLGFEASPQSSKTHQSANHRPLPVLYNNTAKKGLKLLTPPIPSEETLSPGPGQSPLSGSLTISSRCSPSPSSLPSTSQRRELPLKEKYAGREPNADGTYSCEAVGCEVCQTNGIQKFTQLCKLEKHEDKTTKPYCCPVTDCRQGRNVRGFSRRDNRATHVKDIHPELLVSNSSSPSTPSDATSKPTRQQRRPRQTSHEETFGYDQLANQGSDEEFVVTVKRRVSPGRNENDGSFSDDPQCAGYHRPSFRNSRHSPSFDDAPAVPSVPSNVLNVALQTVKRYRSEGEEDGMDYRQKRSKVWVKQ